MKLRRTLSIALLLAMLLSMFSGGFANAASSRTVTAGEELAFDPLAETASIAYERHESGYTVALDRSAESATMRISAVPAESGRSAEGARLYIRTGVTPKAGAAYRVSFALTAEKAQPEYAVSFDGAAEGAYGMLAGRSIEAGATDRVGYYLTPDAADGELVLRLLLGKTGAQGNTLRFSALAVEEVSAAKAETGANLLSDKLNYNEPGFIRLETNDDARATITSTTNSATLTVTNAPAKSEVWKIKLLVATGVKPIAGRVYRFRATLTSSAPRDYETAYNEGATEKGYDVVYEQKLLSGAQSIEHMIYVPADKANPGELIVQFAVGKLKTGDKVTVSGIRVEEATPSYSNALPSGFSLDKTNKVQQYEYDKVATGYTDVTPAAFDWASVGKVEIVGDRTTNEIITTSSAQLEVETGSANAFDAKFNIYTGIALDPDTFYRVRLKVESSTKDFNYQVQYGKYVTGWANNAEYGTFYCRAVVADKPDQIEHLIKPADATTELKISILVGDAAAGTIVKISDLQIEKMTQTGYDARRGSGGLPYYNFVFNEYTTTGRPDGTDIQPVSYGHYATITVPEDFGGNDYNAQIVVKASNEERLKSGKNYRVSFDIVTDADSTGTFTALYGTGADHKGISGGISEGWEGGGGRDQTYGKLENLSLAKNTPITVRHSFCAAGKENAPAELWLTIQLGNIKGGITTVRNVRVEELPAQVGDEKINTLTYSDSYFKLKDAGRSTISYPGDYVNLYFNWEPNNKDWQRLAVLCAADFTVGSSYELSYTIQSDEPFDYDAYYNYSYDNIGLGTGSPDINKIGKLENESSGSSATTVKYYMRAAESTQPAIFLDLGQAQQNKNVRVSNVTVKAVSALLANAWNGTDVLPTLHYLTALGHYADSAYTATLTPHAGDASTGYAELNVTAVPSNVGAHDESKVKLEINTGFVPEAGKDYRVSFNIAGTAAQNKFFLILYGYYGGDPSTEKIYGEKYEQSVTTTATTISHVISRNGGSKPLMVQIQLGNVNATNTFTVSNLKIEEVHYAMVPRETDGRITGTVYSNLQPGYGASLSRTKDTASYSVTTTPSSSEMENWKNKLFVDTGVYPRPGEAYLVSMEVSAAQNMDFEVCYNADSIEKGYGAIYDLKAAAGTPKKLEKMLFISEGQSLGKLIVQLSLGKVASPNTITVSNVKVERVSLSYGGSAIPGAVNYRAPGAVTCFVHDSYTAKLTGSDNAATMNITKPPVTGADDWKIKLFIDTGVVPEAGKYYRVVADVNAKAAQEIAICYNNGGAENGYDSLTGVRLAAGETQTVEKLIAIDANKTDTNNLMLQFNLGKAAAANTITVSGVAVEEVPVEYVDAMEKGFSYKKAVSVWTDPKMDYRATAETADGKATLHVTNAPATGTGVWMVKLLVKTGAILSAGKSYLVHADLQAARSQDYEVCFNNEETEKGFGQIYGQKLTAGKTASVDKQITVPNSMTDAGELILQFSVGSSVTNDITVSNVTVQEIDFGAGGEAKAPDTVVALGGSNNAAGTLDVTREKLTYHMTKISAASADNAIRVAGADLRSGERYAVAFTAKADKAVKGTLVLRSADGKSTAISKDFTLSAGAKQYSFTTGASLETGGAYDVLWQFGGAENQKLGDANVELSGISVFVPSEKLVITRSAQKLTLNGKPVTADAYNINGSNYFRVRDLAALLNGTDAQFVVRYNGKTNTISLTTGKEYTTIGNELTIGPDQSTSCVRSPQDVMINGKTVSIKAYNIGGNNFFRLRDLDDPIGFRVDYLERTNTVAIASPLTPEAQEKAHEYATFFLPEIDGESQPYVGDTMPFYDNGTYYIYYLKESGDSYNHSVYLTTTKDFVNYTEMDDPVLSASRGDVQDSWIGTGSVVKADSDYYFFYTGFNASGSQEYHEKIMVAKGSSPTSFSKVSGWSITPPAELGQKNDFRDPQAYYDPATGTISLTVTAAKNGTASILKYTLGKDLKNVQYDGVIFSDPTGQFFNLECSDTFRIGDKWYLTYSGQEDTLWYAMADSRFGPYTAPVRMDGRLFYAAKHVESGNGSYMVGWTRRAESASSTSDAFGWGGNLTVQQLKQNADGSLSLVPTDSIASAYRKQQKLNATEATLTAGSGRSYQAAFTSSESFMLTGEFTYTGSGSFGLAFDFNGKPEQYKLVSVDPAANKLKLSFGGGATPVTETQAKLAANQKHTFTYIQDGSVGIFYVDDQAALTVRLYGSTDKPIYLFAENNSVTFTSLKQFTR